MYAKKGKAQILVPNHVGLSFLPEGCLLAFPGGAEGVYFRNCFNLSISVFKAGICSSS